MAPGENERLYVIYNGPRPAGAKLPEIRAANAPGAAPPPPLETDGHGKRAAPWGVAALALTVGLVIGVPAGVWLKPWIDPEVGRPDPPAAAAPQDPAPEPPALEITPPPAAPNPIEDRVDEAKAAKAAPKVAPRRQARASAAASRPAKASAQACSERVGRAEQLLCANPQLAAVDRELQQAYDKALAAGTPPERLSPGGAEWMDIREAAAATSAEALASAYQDRIAEVNALADPPH